MPRRAALMALVGAWAIGAASARAEDFTVSSTGDTGADTLRQAVIDANTSTTPPDTITFALDPDETITLSSDLEAVDSATLIFAIDTNPVTVDGNNFVLFQNASTAHAFTFDTGVIYQDGKILFTEATSGTIAGVLKGNDVQLSKTGAGTTTLDGTIQLDAASSVNIDAGTFAVNGDLLSAGTLAVDAPATLQVNNGGTVSAGTVTNDGAINVSTGGTLNATSSLLVNGDLVANGALNAGSLTIASGGALTGTSTSINAPLTVLGRVAPSTSAGTLGITGGTAGDVTFGSSSTFEVDMGPGNSGDSLTATGDITISPGARLVLVADPAAFALATPSTKTVLTGASRTGEFTETDFAFFVEDYDYQADSLTVTLTKIAQSFAPFAQTPNQRAVAQTLDAASATASDDLQDVLDALVSAEATEIGPLLDAIGGETLTAFATARQILAERTSRALHRRARDPMWGSGRALYQPEDYAVDPDEAPLRGGVWFDALGLYGELDGDTGEAEVDTLLYGGTLGGDLWFREHFVVGLAAGYARSDVDLDQRDADVFGDTVHGALYAGYVDPRGYVSAYGRYAYTFETSRREIEASTLSRRARARFDAQDYGAGGELGLTVLSYRGVSLQPIAGIDWLRMDEEDYTEHGAGDLDLIVDPETLESTTTRFGARVFGRIDMDDVGTLVPELRAFYQHLSGDRERVLDARLTGTPGAGSIGVRGAELPRENLLLGLGWGVLVGTNLTVSIDYDALLGSDRVEHQGTLAARVLF